jgi:hypothetical protein
MSQKNGGRSRGTRRRSGRRAFLLLPFRPLWTGLKVVLFGGTVTQSKAVARDSDRLVSRTRGAIEIQETPHSDVPIPTVDEVGVIAHIERSALAPAQNPGIDAPKWIAPCADIGRVVGVSAPGRALADGEQ